LENEQRAEISLIQVSGLQSIKTKIIIFALLATIIPSLTLGILSYVQNRRLLEDKIANQLHSATIQTSGEIALWLKARFYDLKVFSSSYVVSENLQRILGKDQDNIERLVAANRIREYLQSVREKFVDYRELVLVNMIGEPLVTSSSQSPLVNLPAQWFEQLEAGQSIIGSPYWDATIKRRVITLGEEIKSSENQRLGILVTKIDLAALLAILERKRGQEIDNILLTDKKGRLIVSSTSVFDQRSRSDFAASLAAVGAEGHQTLSAYTSFQGQAVVGLGTIIPSAGWVVIAQMKQANAYAGIARLGKITFMLVGFLLLAMGSFAYWLGQSIVRPLNHLSGEAGKVAAGDLQVDIPVSGKSEVSYLTQVFNHMVSSLRRGQAEISQAQEALIEKNQELHLLSITDGLTGLFTRRHLMDLFDMEFVRNKRYQSPFCVMIADIDYFKDINDTYGHLAGDAVLQRIADTLRQSVRECDHVGRYGGEEFLIILPATGIDGAMDMAQRIRHEIDQVEFYNDGKNFSMTISVGVAMCTEGDESAESVLSRADAALYRAKAGGRNRVIGP
jgi:diguanylate cyclase (GGDEF)-like protein